MFKMDAFDLNYEPLAGSTFTNYLRLLAQNKFKITPLGYARFAYCLLLTGVISPFNVYERLKYDKKIMATEVKDPVFILGHFRSGTTFINYMMSVDPQFCYPSTYMTLLPASYISSRPITLPICDSSLPEKRRQDDVILGSHLPQEEDYALGNLDVFSFYHAWCFPRNRDLYYKYVYLDEKEVPEKEIKRFKEVYDFFARKVVFTEGNKRLLMKNPSSTARIKHLLDLYPDAKFVNIHRNPYHVVLSTKRLMEMELPGYTFQSVGKDFDIIHEVLKVYKRMHERYFEDLSLIPKGNFADICYEEFIEDPLGELKRVYDELDLGGFKEAKPQFEKYLKLYGDVKKAKYAVDESFKKRAEPFVRQCLDNWGYN